MLPGTRRRGLASVKETGFEVSGDEFEETNQDMETSANRFGDVQGCNRQCKATQSI